MRGKGYKKERVEVTDRRRKREKDEERGGGKEGKESDGER